MLSTTTTYTPDMHKIYTACTQVIHQFWRSLNDELKPLDRQGNRLLQWHKISNSLDCRSIALGNHDIAKEDNGVLAVDTEQC